MRFTLDQHDGKVGFRIGKSTRNNTSCRTTTDFLLLETEVKQQQFTDLPDHDNIDFFWVNHGAGIMS